MSGKISEDPTAVLASGTLIPVLTPSGGGSYVNEHAPYSSFQAGFAVPLIGTLLARPAATAVAAGTLYFITDAGSQRIQRSTGAAWVDAHLGQMAIDVREFGSLGTADDSAIIQAALDYADGLSYAAIVQMPEGNFNAFNLRVPSLVWFRGHGRSTVITAPNGATGAIITTKTTSSERLHVSDFWLQGNMASATVTGVLFDNNGGTFTGAEPENKLSGMLITNLAVDGVRFNGSRGAHVWDVEVRNATQDCLSLLNGAAPEPGSDGIYEAIWLYAAGRDCLHIEAGANKFIGVKIGQATRYPVYIDSGSFLNEFIGCSVDGTATVGWRIEGHTNRFVACDSNDITGTAVVFTATAYDNDFQGFIWTAPGSPLTVDGVDLQASSTNNTVRVTTTGISGVAIKTTSDVTNNAVIANGIYYGLDLRGQADRIQAKFRGHSTQTNPILTVETSAGADLFNVTNSGVLEVPAMHAASGATGATQCFGANTYTPTPVAVINVAAVVARACWWKRHANSVDVWGACDIDPTAGSARTVFSIPLPIASNFTALGDCGGTFGFTTGTVNGTGFIKPDTVNDVAICEYTSDAGAASQTMHFHFSYQIK